MQAQNLVSKTDAESAKRHPCTHLAECLADHPVLYSVLATSFVNHPKLRYGRTFPEVPDRKRQREAYKRWVFDYWAAADLGLGKAQYGEFSAQYDVERPVEIDELPETDDRGFLDGIAALFGQEQDEADERGTSFGEFNQLDDNAAAEAAYRLALALQGVLDTHLPSAQGEAAVAVRLWREAAEARGDTGPGCKVIFLLEVEFCSCIRQQSLVN